MDGEVIYPPPSIYYSKLLSWLVFISPAALGTVPNLIPVTLPFLSPRKGFSAGLTKLLGEVFFSGLHFVVPYLGVAV